MVTRRYQNSCIFAVFLKYLKFPSVKVFKNLMLNFEYGKEQYIKSKKNRRISFLDICNF